MESKIKKKPLYNKINREELKLRVEKEQAPKVTLSFYKYAHIDEPEEFRNTLYLNLTELGVLGRIYIAREGINAQISVPEENFVAFRDYLETIDFLKGVRLNIAIEDDPKAFFLLKVKVRGKIVADGIDDPAFDSAQTGTHLNAVAFNEITADPDTVVVDMRNHYESEVGHFEHAITPDVETFRESLPIVADLLADKKDKKIVMYCTGGIRCEKASAYMRYKGFTNVFQLEGGIIEYARQVNKLGLDNKFKGKNFVFDERLGERISEDILSHCHQCGQPSDDHRNCANHYCHLLIIQCDSCAVQYHGCCSEQCSEFMQLPEEKQQELAPKTVFNGSRFGKGRRPPKKDEV